LHLIFARKTNKQTNKPANNSLAVKINILKTYVTGLVREPIQYKWHVCQIQTKQTDLR